MNKTSNQKAITLVALIITVIVLLILAVVAINAISGDGILGYAKNAREIYEIEQIKEEAELVKLGMQMDIASGGLNKDRLLTALNEHFTGSTLAGNIVTTADGKYDIIVDDDLNITVEKHGENGGNGGNGGNGSQGETIEISYTIENLGEDRKVIKLSYNITREITTQDLELKLEELSGVSITDEIRGQLQEQAEDLEITYNEILLENILQLYVGETITDEIRAEQQAQATSNNMTYEEYLIMMFEEGGISLISISTEEIEAKYEEVTKETITNENRTTWATEAESYGISYKDRVLELILENVSKFSITNELRTQLQEQAIENNMTYENLLISILSDSYKISFEPKVTAQVLLDNKSVEVDGSCIAVTKNGTYKVVVTTESGAKDEVEIPITDVTEEKFSEIYTASADYTDVSGKKARIPAGFAVGTSDSINEGLVITDKVDSEGYSIGNEFIWIPVENINNMVMCQTHGASTTINQETLQCETCGENTKLAGKLYATTTGKNFNANLTGQTYSADSGLREPANLSDDTVSNMSSWTPTLYQDSFDAMVESVAKYKGFYVGRYETSLNGSTAQSKLGERPMNNINWFRMYENSKTYSSTNTSLGVVSEMIWGSQWDAMLKFILTTEDASHVTASNNVNHSLSDPYKTGGTTYYNYEVDVEYNDKSANIYDLEGNADEWTQEAYDTNFRVDRGGDYGGSYSPSFRSGLSPTDFNSYSGSRLSLYVEV